MSPRAGFVVYLVVAVLTAIIAGQYAALMHSPGMVIASWAAGTFAAVLGLCMTADYFVRQPPAAP